MDSPWLSPLRSLLGAAALSLTVAALASPCLAQDSRDGSPQADPGYRGPLLSWAGKTDPTEATNAPAAPEPAASPPPTEVASQPLSPPTPPAAFSADDRRAPVAPPEPVAMSASPAPVAAVAPPAAPTSPPPVQLAQAAPPAAPAGAASAPVSVRYYSLHREYGMTPDPITLPPARPMVLIGPPDNPPAQAPSADGAASDGQDDAGDPNAAAHHPTGQDAN